jgi:hypothetical protein
MINKKGLTPSNCSFLGLVKTHEQQHTVEAWEAVVDMVDVLNITDVEDVKDLQDMDNWGMHITKTKK